MSHRSREGVSARAEANRQTWRDSEASVRSKMRQRIRGLRERMREEKRLENAVPEENLAAKEVEKSVERRISHGPSTAGAIDSGYIISEIMQAAKKLVLVGSRSVTVDIKRC